MLAKGANSILKYGSSPYSLPSPPPHPSLDKVKPCKKRASFFVYEFFLGYVKKVVMAFTYRIPKNSFIRCSFFFLQAQ